MRAIIMYHSIDSSGSPISVSEEAFRAQARFLASGRVSVVPLADLPSVPDEKDAVALTFDDGFRSFTTVAGPILSDHNLPATIFVVSDGVGGTNDWGGRKTPRIPTLPLMGWQDVRHAMEAGFEIGAHTRTHPDLTTLSRTQLEDEVEGGADRIAMETGRRPRRFAYPFGAVNDAALAVARENFDQCVTTELRMVDRDDDMALLPRLDAWYFQRDGMLESWGSPAFRRWLWVRAQGRRVRALMAAAGLLQ